MKTFLITGTDTDTGKTVFITALVAYWQAFYDRKSLGLMKLLQTGVGDRELYDRLFANKGGIFRRKCYAIEIVAPLCFSTPVAPPIAAAKEGKTIDLGIIWRSLTELQQKHEFVLIEALGGLGSPVTDELTVADLARDWRLPILLVVPVKLGAIGQSVANIALARQNDLEVKGIVLNCIQPESEANLDNWAAIELIQSLTKVPVIGTIPYLAEPTNLDKLTQVAANLDLEMFLIGK
jgi:dethiobiotin synthetase